MPDIRKALKVVADKAKAVVYPDKEALRRQWKVKDDQKKVNQIRRK